MEQWKDISGYENKYQVSNSGRVKSLRRKVTSGRGGLRTIKERLLKTRPDKDGYRTIDLRDENQKQKTHKVHRLVAEAFILNPDEKPQVNHKNENKSDNKANNLEWATCSENIIHGTYLERRSSTRTNGVGSKAICQYDLNGNLIKEWESLSEAGRNGFFKTSISRCCLGKSEHHRGYKWAFKE